MTSCRSAYVHSAVDGAAASFEQRLHAPDPRAARRDIKENETVNDRELALVNDRQEVLHSEMDHEVGDRHHSARDKGGDAGKEADHYQKAAEQFDRSADGG